MPSSQSYVLLEKAARPRWENLRPSMPRRSGKRITLNMFWCREKGLCFDVRPPSRVPPLVLATYVDTLFSGISYAHFMTGQPISGSHSNKSELLNPERRRYRVFMISSLKWGGRKRVSHDADKSTMNPCVKVKTISKYLTIADRRIFGHLRIDD